MEEYLYEAPCGHPPTYIYYSKERRESQYSLIILQYTYSLIIMQYNREDIFCGRFSLAFFLIVYFFSPQTAVLPTSAANFTKETKPFLSVP